MCYNEKEVIKIKILLLNHFPLTGSGSGVYTQNTINRHSRFPN